MNLINKWKNKLETLKLVKAYYQRMGRETSIIDSVKQDINLIKEFIKDLKEYE